MATRKKSKGKEVKLGRTPYRSWTTPWLGQWSLTKLSKESRGRDVIRCRTRQVESAGKEEADRTVYSGVSHDQAVARAD